MKLGAAPLGIVLALACLTCRVPAQPKPAMQMYSPLDRYLAAYSRYSLPPSGHWHISTISVEADPPLLQSAVLDGWVTVHPGPWVKLIAVEAVAEASLDEPLGVGLVNPFTNQPASNAPRSLYSCRPSNPIGRRADGGGVKESIKFKTYEVGGKTAKEVVQNASSALQIRSEEGEAMIGATLSAVWVITKRQIDNSGREGLAVGITVTVTGADVILRTSITMPLWLEESKASKEDQDWWAQAMRGLLEHECGHATISREQATKLHQVLRGTASSAVAPTQTKAIREAEKKLASEVRAKINRISQETAERQKEYDKKTDHGRRQDQARD